MQVKSHTRELSGCFPISQLARLLSQRAALQTPLGYTLRKKPEFLMPILQAPGSDKQDQLMNTHDTCRGISVLNLYGSAADCERIMYGALSFHSLQRPLPLATNYI